MTASDFWSRRKAAVEAEAEAEVIAKTLEDERAQDLERDALSDADLLADVGQPEPEQLDSAEAVQAFLKSNLPQRLKTRAFRQLWRLNPALANLDGLVDYGEDYTDAATVIDNLQTVYQVGKGMLAKLEELGAEEEAEADGSSDALASEPDVPAIQDPSEPPPLPQAQDPVFVQTEPDIPESAPATIRRMRFQFDSPRASAEGVT